jgi:YhcH/YjgK/YiaL family protein
MALYGTFATVRAQAPQTAGFDAAFAYVEDLLRPDSEAARRLGAIAPGTSHKVDLGGGTFVMEQAYATKPRAEGFFESHRKYIDVQVVVAGEELMELADAAHLTIKSPYEAERDLIVWEDNRDASHLRVRPGDAAIFFPVDVHMPALQVRPGASLVRKAVVKVPVA